MPNPEIPLDQKIVERPSEVISETLTQAGVNPTPTTVKPIVNNQGQPLVTPTPSTSGKIQISANQASLIQKAKGKVSSAATWLAKFMLRLIAKQGVQNASTNDTNTDD